MRGSGVSSHSYLGALGARRELNLLLDPLDAL